MEKITQEERVKDFYLSDLESSYVLELLRRGANAGILGEVLQSALSPEQLSQLRNEPIALLPLLKAHLREVFRQIFHR